jgi:hypothetical protein
MISSFVGNIKHIYLSEQYLKVGTTVEFYNPTQRFSSPLPSCYQRDNTGKFILLLLEFSLCVFEGCGNGILETSSPYSEQ